MSTTDTRPISVRLPQDLANEIDRTKAEDTRTRTDQVEHLLRVGLAGRARLKALEQLASDTMAQTSHSPNTASAAAAAHLARHRELCGFDSQEQEISDGKPNR